MKLTDTQSNENKPAVAPVTKGEKYGAVIKWAIDITVPAKWNKRRDRDYVAELMGDMTGEKLHEQLCATMEDYHGILTFAFCYLTSEEFEPYDCIFRHLPVATKVELIRKLFRQRSQDAGYLERFDSDLRRFLDVEQICMPVLRRYLLDPDSVWLRELADVYNCTLVAVGNLSESLACEHGDCGIFLHVDRIDPPSRHRLNLPPGPHQNN